MKEKADRMSWAACIAVLLLGASASLSFGGERVIADQFNTKGLGRKAGNPLFGVTTEVGDVDWSGAPADAMGAVFTDRGSVTAGSDKAMTFSVEVPTGAREIRLEAEIKVRETAWVGLALGGDGLEQGFFTPKGAYLFAILRPGASYSVFANAAKQIQVAEAKAKGVNTLEFCRMEMVYAVAENQLTVRLNDHVVVESRNLTELGYTPGKIKRAGFRFQGPPMVAGSPEVKNFKLTVTE